MFKNLGMMFKWITKANLVAIILSIIMIFWLLLCVVVKLVLNEICTFTSSILIFKSAYILQSLSNTPIMCHHSSSE